MHSSITKFVLGVLSIAVLLSCSKDGVMMNATKLDMKNADTFVNTYQSMIADMPEIERQRLLEDINFIHREKEFPERFDMDDLYQSESGISFQEIVLESGTKLDGRSAKEIAKMANELRRKEIIGRLNLIEQDSREQAVTFDEQALCNQTYLAEQKAAHPEWRADIYDFQQIERQIEACKNVKRDVEILIATIPAKKQQISNFDFSTRPDESIFEEFPYQYDCKYMNNFCPKSVLDARAARMRP